jgi:hypothetical protein
MSKSYRDNAFRVRKVAFGVVIISILLFLVSFGYCRALYYSFDGVIEKVTYDEPKHIPTITVKGIDYNLIYNSLNKGQKADIEKGDTAKKTQGSLNFILIKKRK